jgi:hypothetical protein
MSHSNPASDPPAKEQALQRLLESGHGEFVMKCSLNSTDMIKLLSIYHTKAPVSFQIHNSV